MKITAAESQIMEALWRAEAPLAVEDLQRELREDWADGTVRAFLNRLLRKKAVAATKDGKRSLYRPLLARADYVHTESKGLIDRLFDGRLAPLVTHFSERHKLSARDIAELKRLVSELDDGK